MTRRNVGRIAVAVAAVTVTGVTPQAAQAAAPGTPSSSAVVKNPCTAVVTGFDESGALVRRMDGNGTGGRVTDVPAADQARRITAMTDVEHVWDDGVPDDRFDESFTGLAVVGGRLKLMSWEHHETGITRDPSTGTARPGTSTYTTRVLRDYGRGWAGMSSVHQAPMNYDKPAATRYLYGFRQGTLYRWAPVHDKGAEVVRWRSAGKVAGFSAVRGLALVGSDSRSDVFLGTTRWGSLIRVTVPTTARMTSSSVRLRNTGWSGYTRLVPARCDGTVGVVAADARGRARLFLVGKPAGLRTSITPSAALDLRGVRVPTPTSRMP